MVGGALALGLLVSLIAASGYPQMAWFTLLELLFHVPKPPDFE
jgi:hypothetical protein